MLETQKIERLLNFSIKSAERLRICDTAKRLKKHTCMRESFLIFQVAFSGEALELVLEFVAVQVLWTAVSHFCLKLRNWSVLTTILWGGLEMNLFTRALGTVSVAGKVQKKEKFTEIILLAQKVTAETEKIISF